MSSIIRVQIRCSGKLRVNISKSWEHNRGFAAAHGGKPLAYHSVFFFKVRGSASLEWRWRRSLLKKRNASTESQRLSAMCCGKAAGLEVNGEPGMSSLPIACNLTGAELQERRRTVLQ